MNQRLEIVRRVSLGHEGRHEIARKRPRLPSRVYTH